MIAAKYNQALIDREFIRMLTDETATDIYDVQMRIAQASRRSGQLYRYLSRRPFSITATGADVRLVMNFPLRMRYMDLKRSRLGNTKQNYTPIYNKIVFGFIYGYLYKQLMYGISQQMNEAITQRLQNAGYKLQ